jgi:hypothetical protein
MINEKPISFPKKLLVLAEDTLAFLGFKTKNVVKEFLSVKHNKK